MKLGIDASNIRAGGGITHLVELLRNDKTQEFGFKQVIVWGGASTLNRLEDRPWLRKVYEPVLDKGLSYRLCWQWFRLDRLVRAAGCNILFVPGGSYWGPFRPFVTMSQNLIPFQRKEIQRYGLSWMFLRNMLLHWSQKKTFHVADGLIFLTPYAHDVVMKEIKSSRGRIAIIPHGVDQHFLLAPRMQKDLKNYSLQKPFRLLYVSNIDLYKHQWHVAEAVAKLREAGYPIQIDFIGSAYPPALKRLRRALHKFDPRGAFIHYQGEIPYSKLFNLYRQADVFVFASSCETFGQIVTEAMAAGLPIACSSKRPMSEILEDSAVYFDPEKPLEIADALKRLIDSPNLRAKTASAAYKKAKAYTWENCAHDTFNFLSQIAANSNRYYSGLQQK